MRRRVRVDRLSATDQARLLAWFSPSFPTGGFGFSHGLETLVEAGTIGDRATLADWIEADLRHGPGWCDALLFAETWRAVERGDEAALRETAELAAALRGTAELAQESLAQGRAFLAAVQGAWPTRALLQSAAKLQRAEIPLALPVAAGLACAAHAIALQPALLAFLHAAAASLISAGVRLVPLGQTDALLALATLEPALVAVTQAAAAGSLDDLGSAALALDLASMAHETQHSRLFRS